MPPVEILGQTYSADVVVLLLLLLGIVGDRLALWGARRFLKTPGAVIRFALWATIVCRIFLLFPQTKEYAQPVHTYFVRPLSYLVLTMLIALAVSIILNRVLTRYLHAVEVTRTEGEPPDSRWHQRIEMVLSVITFTIQMVVFVVALLALMLSLEVNVTALVTGSGLLGIAVGLACQDLLKDVSSGVAIIIEDQFGVGDCVTIAGHTGIVESFSLRITRLRTAQGALVTIPNSDIRIVENLSSGWAQVDLQVGVGYEADLDKAREVMLRAGQEVRAELPDLVTDDPHVLGVEQLDASSVVLRMQVRTLPLRQFEVRRLLLQRIKMRFDEAGIEIPFQQVTVRMRNNGEVSLKS